jgi:biotin carboxyl carrier protein
MPKTFIATIGSETITLPESRVRNECSGTEGSVAFIPSLPGTHLMDLRHRKRHYRVYARTLSDGSTEIWVGRYRVVVGLQEEGERLLSSFVRSAAGVSSGCSVKAPMPGLIKEIAVSQGDVVKKGQRLLTLEAMKMENEISSPIDGVVEKCRLSPGVNVDKDQELIHITPSVDH